jgi:hypothetical protein
MDETVLSLFSPQKGKNATEGYWNSDIRVEKIKIFLGN